MCENKANRFLLRMANLLIFIDNGGIELLYSLDLKNGTNFSCYENLPKGHNVQMSLCFTLT